MKASRLALIIFMLYIGTFIIIGCSGDSGNNEQVGATDGSPVACFTMSMELEENANCVYQFEFILDPSCSSDDNTSTNDLEVRWDYDNDGEWDTDFGSMSINNDYTPDPAIDVWTSRCQVRDLAGNVSETTKSVELGPFPVSPDLIAGSIRFEDFDFVEEVQVGQSFSIVIYETCYGDFLDPSFTTKLYQDGVLIDSSSGGCSGGLFGCGGGGKGGYTIDTPGTYEFTAIIDSENDYTETDETNNTVSATLSVIP